MKTEPTYSESSSRGQALATLLTIATGALAALLRVVPHPANFTPLGALGLFGGGRLRSWHAYALPLAVMAASDFGLWTLSGFDDKYSVAHISRVYVYASLLLYVAIGQLLLRRQRSLPRLLTASLLGSLQFFLVTNFFVWLLQPWETPDATGPVHYARDLGGLLECYALALPFLRHEVSFSIHSFIIVGDMRLGLLGTLLGDLTFTGLLYGAYALLAPHVVRTERAPAAETTTA